MLKNRFIISIALLFCFISSSLADREPSYGYYFENGIKYKYYFIYDTRAEEEQISNLYATIVYNEKEQYSGKMVIPSTVTIKKSNIVVYDGTWHNEDEVTMPVRSIDDDAFVDCKGLISITIPSSITFQGEEAFYYYTIRGYNLNNPFRGCSNLEKIVFEEGHPFYNECNAIIVNNKLISGCKNTIVPEEVRTIGPYAFSGLESMASIDINKVTTVNEGAFKGCNNIHSLVCRSSLSPRITYSEDIIDELLWEDVFDESMKNTTLFVNDFCIEKYKEDRIWGQFKEIVPIEKVTDFNLTYYVDGEVYKTVQYKYDDEITPEPAPIKEGYTFSGWSEIPERMPGKDVSVTGTFSTNTYKLNYYVDGELYKSYEVKFNEAIKPEAEPTKEDFAFSGWSEIPQTMPARDVDITGGFTRIAVTVDNVTYKFEGDNAVVTKDKGKSGDVVIASSVESDGKTYDVVGIANNVFKNNSNITSVAIPDGVVSVGEYAFSGCKNLKAISIGSGIKSIGTRAFANIDKLTDVTVGAIDVPETDRTAFESSYLDYVTLHVPYGAVEKYKAAGPWKDFKEIVAIEGTQRTFVLTYMVDEEVYKTYEVKEGEAITPEPEPTKEGYTFSGWSEIPAIMPAHDVEVTGSFTVNKYKLIYKVNGEVYKEYEIEYGAEIIPEEEPTKEGWEFSGWSWIPKKMPAEDVIITGTFTQIEYDVEGGKYIIDDDEATIVDGGDAEGEVVIDATIIINGKTYRVTVIGEGAYHGNDKITSVDIPDGIETILANAFFNCGGINTLKIGKTIKYIGSKAFGNIWTSAVGRRASDNPLTIECHSESVPEADADCFDGTPIANAVLLVEDALVDSYKAVSPWCYFGEIKGFNEASGIDTIFAGQQNAVFYSIDGQRLDAPRKGMNIIKTNHGVKKVIIK